MPLKRTLHGAARAWRYTRQGGAVQDIWTANVSASVRAFEVTHGRRHGWHPHVHVLLRTVEWTDEEKAILLERWKLMVRRELGDECVPDDAFAIVWSDPIELCKGDALTELDERRTRYLFKLGLELAGSNKRGRRGSRSHWQVAEDAANGDQDSIELWREFCKATKGRQMIALDARAQRFAKQAMPLALADSNFAKLSEENQNQAEPVEPSDVQRVEVCVDSIELRALREYERSHDPAILAVILADVAVSQSPETTVRRWIDLVTTALRYHGRHGERAPPGSDTS